MEYLLVHILIVIFCFSVFGNVAEANYVVGGGSAVNSINVVGIGPESKVSDSEGGVTIGRKAEVSAHRGISIGDSARARNMGGVAIGAYAIDTGERSISIGFSACSSANSGVSIGSDSQVKSYGGVAVGAYSVSDRKTVSNGIYVASGAQRDEIDRIKNTVKSKPESGVVSIGNEKMTRQLTGLAAGIQDTDAVNVAQIKALDSVVSAISNNVEAKYTELGGKIAVNEKSIAKNTTSITNNTNNIAKHTTDITNNANNIAKNTTDITNNVVNIIKNTTDIANNAANITKNTIDITNNAVNITKNTIDITNNTNNIEKNTTDITNNANNIAKNTTDITNNTNNIAKHTTDITNNANNIAKNTTNITNNANNIAKNTTNITNNTNNIAKNTTDITDVKKSVDTKHAELSAMITSQDKNITYLQNGIGALDELSVKYDGKAKDIITLNKKADGTMGDAVRITNVANGEISRNSTDAVTGKQLWSLGDHMAKALGGTIKIVDGVVAGFSRDGGNPENGGSATSPLLLSTLYVNGKEEKTSNGNLSIVNGSNLEITHVDGSLTFNVSKTPEFERVQVGNVDISQDGIKMGGNSITGLANGGIYQGSTDAVNGGQLWNAYRRIDAINERVQIVGAHAAALSALHPVPYNPYEPTTFSAGFGMYRNEQSVAIGVFHYVRENMLVNVGLSLNTDGDTMGRAGISFAVGTGSKKKQPVLARDMVEMQRMMMAMQEKMAQLEQKDEQNRAVIRDLKDVIQELKEKDALKK
ncbi:YadA-like family protein [Cloacibacillus evryensis]|uniref:YadA-like family protein n=2 Tax=Cloacibacillus evryensis TaxID=508460 RepID=A0AAW5KA38_9BACT|nr:YadA-like family protein [Cloacibacillus evryensis]MCQ4815137.1 YadA-like family protein [Cloacibacillus evryensis]